jgi:hypothetical protein
MPRILIELHVGQSLVWDGFVLVSHPPVPPAHHIVVAFLMLPVRQKKQTLFSSTCVQWGPQQPFTT